MNYYDMDGNVIDLMTWVKTFEDVGSRRVAETHVWPGWWVSTVLLGFDHGFGGGPPLIFETMVFHARHKGCDFEMERYATKAEAVRGHAEMVRRVRRQRVRGLGLYLKGRDR